MIHYKKYFVSNTEIWPKHFQSLHTFIDKYHRLPSKESSNAHEKFLGNWLGTQNKNYKNNVESMRVPAHKSCWEKFKINYNQYFISKTDSWNTKLHKARKFIIKNKRLPLVTSTVKSERILAEWLKHCVMNYKNNVGGMRLPEQRKLWEQFRIDFKNYLITKIDRWNINLQTLADFIIKNKRLPKNDSKDPLEKFLYRWICTQKDMYKKHAAGMKTPERRASWEKFVRSQPLFDASYLDLFAPAPK